MVLFYGFVLQDKIKFYFFLGLSFNKLCRSK